MFEKIRGFFSEHASLLTKKFDLEADFSRRLADSADEIARLEADCNYRIVQRAKQVETQIEEARRRQGLLRADRDIKLSAVNAEIDAAANPAISEFQAWCRDDIIRTLRELTMRGTVEQNEFGGAVGRLSTNQAKVDARVDALKVAIAEAEALRRTPQDNVPRQLKEIRSRIPLLDTTAEEIDCAPAIAAGLVYPPAGRTT